MMPMIRRRAAGRIVCITSVSGLIGNRGQVNYSASKAGLIGAANSDEPFLRRQCRSSPLVAAVDIARCCSTSWWLSLRRSVVGERIPSSPRLRRRFNLVAGRLSHPRAPVSTSTRPPRHPLPRGTTHRR